MGDLPFDLGLSRTIIVVMVQYRMRYLAVAHSNANTGKREKQDGKQSIVRQDSQAHSPAP